MKNADSDHSSPQRAIKSIKGFIKSTISSAFTGSSNLDEGSGRHVVCEITGKPILRKVPPLKEMDGDSPAACPDSFRRYSDDQSVAEETKKEPSSHLHRLVNYAQRHSGGRVFSQNPTTST